MSLPNVSSSLALNILLLERLKSAPGQFVALDELGDDRARVWHDLEALEQFGFQIERHPYLGVAYHGPTPRLCPDQIGHGLKTRRIGRRIAVWNRVGSTNDLAARAGSNLANDGLVVLAEEQTAGRGQRGRHWTAPPRSSILMSVLVFPSPDWAPWPLVSLGGCAWLTALAAVATAELVSDLTGAEARIKWPNDVRVDGRKIAGILVERALPALPGSQKCDGSPTSRGIVIGIGLNVNLDPDIFPPDLRNRVTSLVKLSEEREMDRSDIARRLIILLDTIYESSLTLGLATLSRLWRARSEHLGRMVHLITRDGRLGGRVIDLDLDRGLTLHLDTAGSDAISTRQLPLENILTLEE